MRFLFFLAIYVPHYCFTDPPFFLSRVCGAPSFRSNTIVECRIEQAGWSAVAASGAFLAATLLLCCAPRPDPCFGTVCCRKKDLGTEMDEKDIEAPPAKPEVSSPPAAAAAAATVVEEEPKPPSQERPVAAPEPVVNDKELKSQEDGEAVVVAAAVVEEKEKSVPQQENNVVITTQASTPPYKEETDIEETTPQQEFAAVAAVSSAKDQQQNSLHPGQEPPARRLADSTPYPEEQIDTKIALVSESSESAPRSETVASSLHEASGKKTQPNSELRAEANILPESEQQEKSGPIPDGKSDPDSSPPAESSRLVQNELKQETETNAYVRSNPVAASTSEAQLKTEPLHAIDPDRSQANVSSKMAPHRESEYIYEEITEEFTTDGDFTTDEEIIEEEVLFEDDHVFEDETED